MTQYLHMPWSIAVFAALLPVFLAVPLVIYMRRTSDQRLTQKIMKRYSLAVEKDVVLADGIDGYLFVDYLILLRGKIIVIKIDPNHGYIFGGEKIDEWTCVENNKTGKFKNPLQEVGFFAQQVKYVSGFNAVDACVLFGSKALFPKGVPAGVLQMASFAEELATLSGSDDDPHETAQQAWEKLIAIMHEDKRQLNAVLAS